MDRIIYTISCKNKKCEAPISVAHLRLPKQLEGTVTSVQLDMEPALEFKSNGIETFLECPKCGGKNIIEFDGEEWDIVDVVP